MRKRMSIALAVAVFALLSHTVLADPKFVAVGWTGNFTHIDAPNGEVPPSRTDLPQYMQALAYSTTGALYVARHSYGGGTSDIQMIDPMTGETTFTVSVSEDVRGMAISPAGTLYVSINTSTVITAPHRLGTIDLSDGSYTDIAELWGDENIAQGLAYSPGGQLYAISPKNHLPGDPVAYNLTTVDTATARMHLVGSFTGPNISQSIAFTPDGRLHAVGWEFARLNPTTGAVIGSTLALNRDYRGMEFVDAPSGAKRWHLYD